MRRASLAGLGLSLGLLLAPGAAARELTAEELREMPRPDALPASASPPEAEPPPLPAARALTAEELREMPRPDALPTLAEPTPEPEPEPLPITTQRWPEAGRLRGTLGLGTLGEQPRWRLGLSGRPLPKLGWGVEAYHRLESPDVYGLRASGVWRSAPWLLLEGHFGREVLGRDGAEAELAALGAWRLDALTLMGGPAAGARLSSSPHGLAGAVALLQHGPFTLRYDYRLRWTRIRQEGTSHLLQVGWMSGQGLLVAARAFRANEPPDDRAGPRWLREELSVLLEVPVTADLTLQGQGLLGRRFEPSALRPALSPGLELGLGLSF